MRRDLGVAIGAGVWLVWVMSACAACSKSNPGAGSDGGGGGRDLSAATGPGTARDKLKHIVIILQENRSFDHYFGTFPGAEGIPVDKSGNPTVFNIDPRTGMKVYPFHTTADINGGGPHGSSAAIADIDGGKMDGFVAQQVNGSKNCKPNDPACTGAHADDAMSWHDDRE